MTTSERSSSRWRGKTWAVNVPWDMDNAEVGAVDVQSVREFRRGPESALGPLAAANLGYILVGAKVFPMRVCPTYLLFGVNCPICGLTRGCSAVLRGHLGRASRRHWASVPVTATVLAISFRWVWEMTR